MKNSKDCAKLVAKIAAECVRITLETDYVVFCDWSGHVRSLTVRVYEHDHEGEQIYPLSVDYHDPIYLRSKGFGGQYKKAKKVLADLKSIRKKALAQ